MKNTIIKIAFILTSIVSYLFIKSFDVSGIDVAYEDVYSRSTNFNTFISFYLGQGYASVPLWLYYVFSNFLGMSYSLAHTILGTFYIYNIFDLLNLSEINFSKSNKLIFKISFILFFVFGQFGLALILSAEKMLLAMIFLFLASKASIKNKENLKYLYYIFSMATHFSMIVSIFLIEYETIKIIIMNFLNDLRKQKIKTFSTFAIIISSIFGSIGIINILNKLTTLFNNRAIGENVGEKINSSYLIIICVFILFFLISKINFQNIFTSILSIMPVYLKLPLGRIAWLYTFAVFLKPIFFSQKIKNEDTYIIFISIFTIYYIYKSVIVFQTLCLFGC